jgi:hypothetical protein
MVLLLLDGLHGYLSFGLQAEAPTAKHCDPLRSAHRHSDRERPLRRDAADFRRAIQCQAEIEDIAN